MTSKVTGPRGGKPKRPKPARGEMLGILNPYGDIWTYETFHTEQAAIAHVAAFWRDIQPSMDRSQFKVVRVRVTVSAIADNSDGKEIPGNHKP